MKTVCAVTLLMTASLQAAADEAVPEPTETVSIIDCDLYIYKAYNNLPDLQNPVLFIEGFDLYNDQNWEELYPLFNKENLIEDLRSQGRDVIILNFTDAGAGVASVNRTANQYAISYINAHRSSVGTDSKFTVIGVSMGGLTSRLALTEFEKQGVPHYVDTWISFDAPHEGANVPLGLQFYTAFFQQFADVVSDFEPMVELTAALNKQSAKEMLLLHYTASDEYGAEFAGNRRALVNGLNRKGYPVDCKNIAISNGSGFGEKHPFNPGDILIHWENPMLPWIDTDIYALPQSTGDNDALKKVFSGLFYVYEGNSTNNYSHHTYSLDNAPGGTWDMFGQLYDMLDYTDGDDYCTYSNHCFVPTASSLGIPLEHLEANLSENPDILALSPFEEVHFGIKNEPHVEINARNKRWFMRAILENIDSDEDGLDDYQEYLIGTDYAVVDSDLAVETVLEPAATAQVSPPLAGTATILDPVLKQDEMTLSYDALPNVEYSLWHTEALDQPWTLFDTIPPTTNASAFSTYQITNAAGYFKTTGEFIDPVTD